ncbi:aminoacyl-histidine dipeptidase [Fusibacter bizertensis]
MEKRGLEEVLHYFKEISKIPRCSLEEQKISDYLVDFAKKHDLEVYQDKMLNVIIKKGATFGYENAPTVILQGHMDMVCEKNEATKHDFQNDPINVVIKDDFMMADGTTLGADNGIAVAFCLAILSATDIPHPALEVLITSQEELGLVGANEVDASKLEGKILINIDSEEEGVLLTSCAGGIRSTIEIPIVWDAISNHNFYEFKVTGLKGGHSGMEIDKNRGNANKILGRILKDLVKEDAVSIADVKGGMKVNAIPREASAKLVFESKDADKVEEKINHWRKVLKNELKSSDNGIEIQLIKTDEMAAKVFSKETVRTLVSLYTLMPSGVVTMSADIEGLVESSTNLGVVSTDEERIVFNSSTRSSVRSLKEDIVDRMETIATLLGLKMETRASYPEWEYKEKSYIRDIFVKVYKNLHGEAPVISAIHAGLECGILSEKINDLDMISFGPNIYDVHTPDEKISISSVENTWEYLCKVLEEVKG